MSETITRKDIWKAMLNADMSARYWKHRTHTYTTRDMAIKVFLAVMMSSTVSSFGFWQTIPWIWQSLLAISAVAAIISPFLNYQRNIERTSKFAGQWMLQQIDWEDLWFRSEVDTSGEELAKEYRKLHRKEVLLRYDEVSLPTNDKLLGSCQEEVIIARGLEEKSPTPA